jgi:phosphatidylserine decarboxylase
VAPYDMTISELSLSRGRPYMPWIMWLETWWVPIFKHFVERNAHAWVTCDISWHTVWLVAVGSLNVNRIHIDHQQWDVLTKWEKLWHFSMWSGILLLFPKQRNIHTALYEKVVIGQHLVSMS